MHQLTKVLAAISLAAISLALAACTNTSPVTLQAFRNPAAPIYSAASLDPSALSGNWLQIAALQPKNGACRKGGGMKIKSGLVNYRLCIDGRMTRGEGALRLTGPGRFAMPGLDQPLWVLWVDEGNRTLVLGTPKGGFGMVLDRGNISSDREAAAREILDWNGYNLGFYNRF